LVVASVRNEDFYGQQTNDSPAKQCPVSNNDTAIETSLEFCVPNVSACEWRFFYILNQGYSHDQISLFGCHSPYVRLQLGRTRNMAKSILA
jgi:hypothetical protein